MKKVVLNLLLMISIIIMGSQVFAAELAYDYEPNNSPDTAYEVYDNSEVISTISNKNDVDYYKFYINGSAETVISLISPQGLDYDIKLYNENYKEIASSKLPMGNMDTISKNSLPAGIYSIKVYSFKKTYSDSPYNLSIKINDSKAPNKPYAGVSEANNANTTMANALEVNKNALFKAKVSSINESRYYKFILDNVSNVDISMIPPKGTDLDIKLYNWYGLEVGSSTNKDGSEAISKRSLYPGTYYLKVYGHNYSFSSDAFQISLKSEKSALKPNNNSGADSKEIVDDSSIIKEAAPISQTSKNVPKALLLYVGLDLPPFTDEDLKKMLIDDPINTKEFFIVDNGSQYNTYMNSYGEILDIVTPAKIDALTKDKVDSTGVLDSIKEDYKKLYKRINRNNSLDYFSNEVFDLAVKLIKTDPDVKITIAIPGTEFHALSEEFIEPVKNILIKGIKERLDKINPDYWKNNIRGYYFSTEGIPYYYTWFNPNKTIDFSNPIVKTMLSFSNEIHQVYNKEFIWIPYYGSSLKVQEYYNKDQAVRIGYIANRTNIFDYIIIQPSYYFKADQKNIPVVQNSSKSNMVLDINNDIVGGIKSSKTLVGAEMEIDARYNTMAGNVYKDYKDRYSEYVKAFSALDKETPIAFYAGTRDEFLTDEVYQAVKSFFASIKR